MLEAQPSRASTAPALASTVGNAIDVLFALQAAGGVLGVSALGRAVGLPKSNVHRLLRTLMSRGLVEQDERGRYRLGFGLVSLGQGVLEADPVVAAARAVLEGAAAELGETVFLAAARAGRVVVLDKAEGRGFLRAAPQLGGVVPVHATAVGKLYRAFGQDQIVEASDEERFTVHTLKGVEAQVREVEAARQRGWAANHEEWIAGLSVVAAPIRPGGRMSGALAVACSTPRMQALGVERVAECARNAADRVARRLAGERT